MGYIYNEEDVEDLRNLKDFKWFFFLKKRRNKGMLILKIKCNKYNVYSNSNGFFFRKKVKKK